MRRFSLVVVVGAVASLMALGSASAGTVGVSGLQTPTATPNVYVMTGSLIGIWTQTSFELGVFTPSGVVTGTGTEQFDGCFDADASGGCGAGDPSGTLFFSYSFSAKYDTLTFAELHGRCHHPITGGTGGFAGASGVLDFKDDPVTGCASYTGHISIAD